MSEQLTQLKDSDAPVAAVASSATLTARLDLKLAELKAAGYEVQWIEVSEPDLVTLFTEGGEHAILMDPDPGADRAWYQTYEVRPGARPCIWIHLTGEQPEMSIHIVA